MAGSLNQHHIAWPSYLTNHNNISHNNLNDWRAALHEKGENRLTPGTQQRTKQFLPGPAMRRTLKHGGQHRADFPRFYIE